jgi:hypothetical protein
MDKSTDKIEGFKNYASWIYEKNAQVYIKDFNGDYYFADIISIQPDFIEVVCFAPDHKKNKKIRIDWLKIIRLDKYNMTKVDK